jgi:hypothetical protein
VTSERQRRPSFVVRTINTAGRALAQLGIEPGQIELDTLLERARVATGLEPFGRDDFRAPLETLLEDMRAMGRSLSTIGRLGLERDLIRSLVTRLRTHELLRRHPEIRARPIDAPLFIVGSPRTGTTMLHNLLSHLPGLRAPMFWELLEPAPRSEQSGGENDPRILAAKQLQAQVELVLPNLFAAHPLIWDWPEECLWLFANSFVSEVYLARLPLPRYRAQFLAADWSVAMLEYREALQLLSWQRSPERPNSERWVLKAPGHTFRMRELAAAFPGARFIRTHRDPRETLASMCSLLEIGQVVSLDLDLHAHGRQTLETWLDHGLARLVDTSDEIDPGQCWDVDFRTLMANPFAEIERMFDHFGLTIGDQTAMQAWLRDNPRHSKGRHTYALSRYGLCDEQVREHTVRYRERFGGFFESA